RTRCGPAGRGRVPAAAVPDRSRPERDRSHVRPRGLLAPVIYEGIRVVDTSRGIAGGDCSRHLTALGAAGVDVQPPPRGPLRGHWATGWVGRDGAPAGVLFRYMHTSQRSVVVGDPARLREWVAAADLVIESFVPGEAEELGIVGVAPVTVSISSFGRGGPDSE